MHHFLELLREEIKEERHFREQVAQAATLEERVKVLEENLLLTQGVLRHLLERLKARLDEEHHEDDHADSRFL